MEAAAASASAVLSNLENAFMETIFFAPSGVLNASWSACGFERRAEGRSVSASGEGPRLAREKSDARAPAARAQRGNP